MTVLQAPCLGQNLPGRTWCCGYDNAVANATLRSAAVVGLRKNNIGGVQCGATAAGRADNAADRLDMRPLTIAIRTPARFASTAVGPELGLHDDQQMRPHCGQSRTMPDNPGGRARRPRRRQFGVWPHRARSRSWSSLSFGRRRARGRARARRNGSPRFPLPTTHGSRFAAGRRPTRDRACPCVHGDPGARASRSPSARRAGRGTTRRCTKFAASEERAAHRGWEPCRHQFTRPPFPAASADEMNCRS